jgi:hypothetical protein
MSGQPVARDRLSPQHFGNMLLPDLAAHGVADAEPRLVDDERVLLPNVKIVTEDAIDAQPLDELIGRQIVGIRDDESERRIELEGTAHRSDLGIKLSLALFAVPKSRRAAGIFVAAGRTARDIQRVADHLLRRMVVVPALRQIGLPLASQVFDAQTLLGLHRHRPHLVCETTILKAKTHKHR